MLCLGTGIAGFSIDPATGLTPTGLKRSPVPLRWIQRRVFYSPPALLRVI
jgi:hypothetical protein